MFHMYSSSAGFLAPKSLHSKLERERAKKRHKAALKRVKPRINNAPPRVFPHLQSRDKKKAKQNERYSQIEKDNRILLQKMANIMERPNFTDVDPHRNWPHDSLHQPLRQQTERRIVQENYSMLGRIRGAAPQLRAQDWDRDWVAHEKYLTSICDYDNNARIDQARKVLTHGPNSRPAKRHGPYGQFKRTLPSARGSERARRLAAGYPESGRGYPESGSQTSRISGPMSPRSTAGARRPASSGGRRRSSKPLEPRPPSRTSRRNSSRSSQRSRRSSAQSPAVHQLHKAGCKIGERHVIVTANAVTDPQTGKEFVEFIVYDADAQQEFTTRVAVSEIDEAYSGETNEKARIQAAVADLHFVDGESGAQTIVWIKPTKEFARPDSEAFEVVLTVVRAENLSDADIGGSSDAFVRASFDGLTKVQTKTIENSCNPTWNEALVMSHAANTPQIVYFELLDEDTGGDDVLGYCQVDLSRVQTSKEVISMGITLKDEIAGQLFVTVSFEHDAVQSATKQKEETKKEETTTNKRPNSEVYDVDLTIHRAEGLNGDPYTKILFGGETFQTKAQSSEDNPVWNETFRLHHEANDSQLVLLTVMDEDFGSDDALGTVQFDLSSQLESVDKIWCDVIQANEKKGRIQVSFDFELKAADQQKKQQEEPKSEPEAPVQDKPEEPKAAKQEPVKPAKPTHTKDDEFQVAVTVVRAEKLHAADFGGKSDPFVKLSFDGVTTEKTKVVDNTINPIWNEVISMTHKPGQPAFLAIQLMDEDPGGDDELGYAQIDLSSLESSDAEICLDVMRKKKAAGKIFIKINFSPESEPEAPVQEKPEEPKNKSTKSAAKQEPAKPEPTKKEPTTHTKDDEFQVAVTVVRAEKLHAADFGGKSDPYVKLSFDGVTTQKTKVVDNTVSPVWNEVINMTHKPGQPAFLAIQLMDEDVGGDDELGYTQIDLSSLESSDAEICLDVTRKKKAAGKIFIKIKFAA